MVGNAWELIATQFLTHVASKDESGVAEFATPVAIRWIGQNKMETKRQCLSYKN